MAEVYRRVARWWEESTRLPPISPGFESRRRWLWCWFPPLLHEVFLRVLRFFSLLKNQHFQTPIWCVKFPYFVGTLCASTVYQLLKLSGVTPVTLVFFVWWILQGVLTSDLKKKKTYGKWKSFLQNKTKHTFLSWWCFGQPKHQALDPCSRPYFQSAHNRHLLLLAQWCPDIWARKHNGHKIQSSLTTNFEKYRN